MTTTRENAGSTSAVSTSAVSTSDVSTSDGGAPLSGPAVTVLALLLLEAATGLVLLFHVHPDPSRLASDLRDLRETGLWGALPALHAWAAVALVLAGAVYLLRRLASSADRRSVLLATIALLLAVATAAVAATLLTDLGQRGAATGGVLARHLVHALVLPLCLALLVANTIAVEARRRGRGSVRGTHLAVAGLVLAAVTALAIVVDWPWPPLPWATPWAALVPSLPGWLSVWAMPLVLVATALAAPFLPHDERPVPSRTLGATLVLLWLAPLVAWALGGPRRPSGDAPLPSLADLVWESALGRPAPIAPLVRELPGLLLTVGILAIPALLVVRRRPTAALATLATLLAARAVATGWLGVGPLVDLAAGGVGWGVRW